MFCFSTQFNNNSRTAVPVEHRVVLVAHFFSRIKEERTLKVGQVLAEGPLAFRLQVLQDALLDILVVRRFDLEQLERSNFNPHSSLETFSARRHEL